eukprot:238563_1
MSCCDSFTQPTFTTWSTLSYILLPLNIMFYDVGGMDALFNFIGKNKLKWLLDEEYDSDSIQQDLTVETQSNIFNQIKDRKTIDFIQYHMNVFTNDDEETDDFEHTQSVLAKRIFNSVHAYLLHDGDELFRTKNKAVDCKMRFCTQVYVAPTKKDEDKRNKSATPNIYEIDFGQNVLNWLDYGETPTFESFKDEIINNTLSTIDAKKYAEYEAECKILCDIVDIDIEVQEMIALKLYTDTTKYQSALRRAFWSKCDKEQKRNFYHWAMTLYKTFSRYSQPTYSTTLYHGLNAVFVVESSLPQYNGIFSTTTQINVANSFSQNIGVLWEILASYSNPFKLVLGIPTDWFSNFKNESEIIIFNSVIPINKVTNFA